jgi:hypothetical protein
LGAGYGQETDCEGRNQESTPTNANRHLWVSFETSVIAATIARIVGSSNSRRNMPTLSQALRNRDQKMTHYWNSWNSST